MSFTADGILTSPWPRVHIPTILYHHYLLEKLNSLDLDETCETDAVSGKTQTYRTVLEDSAKIGAWLQKNGLQSLDRVAFFAANCLEYLPSVLGILRAGGVITYLRREMIVDREYRQKVGVPRFIFATPDRCKDLLDAGFNNVIVFGTYPDCIPFKQLLCQDPSVLEEIEDPCPKMRLGLVTFTGGTTGNPKPIMVSHYSLVAITQFAQSRVQLEFTRDLLSTERPIQLCCFPTTHITCFLYRVVTLVHAPHNIVSDNFLPETICAAVEKYKVNSATLLPGVIISLWRYSDRQQYDMSSFKDVILVGGFLTARLHQQVKEDLKLRSLTLRLGMSDCAGNVTTPCDVYGSIGTLCPNTEARIVDPISFKPITQPGEIGELFIRAPQRMMRYYNMPEKNEESIDNEGFLRTADLVSVDTKGNLFYADRLQEVIHHQSGLVSSMNIEWNLIAIDRNVQETAVIGVPDPQDATLEIAYAFAILFEQPSNPQQYIFQLLETYNGSLTNKNEKLAGLEIVETMPRTVLGKPLKRAMKNDYMKKHK